MTELALPASNYGTRLPVTICSLAQTLAGRPRRRTRAQRWCLRDHPADAGDPIYHRACGRHPHQEYPAPPGSTGNRPGEAEGADEDDNPRSRPQSPTTHCSYRNRSSPRRERRGNRRNDLDLGQIGGAGTVDPPYVAKHEPIFVKATQDPRYAKAFHPDYPPRSFAKGLEGSVTVRVSIDETGRVTAVELVRATNPPSSRRRGERCASGASPATSDGTPIALVQVPTVQFDLEDQ